MTQLSKKTIAELGLILKEEFNLKLDPSELEKLAYSLTGYFGLLEKINSRKEVRK